MKKKNNITYWLLPAIIGTITTAGFLYTIPIRDRGVRLEVTTSEPEKRPSPTPVTPFSQAESQQSAIYRWTDEQGRTHYGNRPPAGVNARAVDPERANVSVVDMAPITIRQQPSSPQPEQQPRQALMPARQEYSTQRQNCDLVKAQIAEIDARMRAGYKARTGEILRERRRHLVELRYAYCH
jgi:hypothetical protein